jgi:hypothetical protein
MSVDLKGFPVLNAVSCGKEETRMFINTDSSAEVVTLPDERDN